MVTYRTRASRALRLARLALLTAVVVGVAATSGAAALKPERTITTALRVHDLALTGGSVAYIEDALPRYQQCGRIGLWIPATGRRFTFDAKEACGPGMGAPGLVDVSVATRRVLWITFAGGNTGEWKLWTASTAQRRPKQLRFVSRDATYPSSGWPSVWPIVIGPGAPDGVPYAVDRELVYLGDDGRPIFERTMSEPVRALAAGDGPGGVRVAALLKSGAIVGLDSGGSAVKRIPAEEPVAAFGLSRRGIAVQHGTVQWGFAFPTRKVSIGSRIVRLPAKATMVDVAQGRILWTKDSRDRYWLLANADLGMTVIDTGKHRLLADGVSLPRLGGAVWTRTTVLGSLDTTGVAWARGRTLYWRPGVVPSR